MSDPVFPVATLGYPLGKSYSVRRTNIGVRTDTENGIATNYNASNGQLAEIKATWTWSGSQYQTFLDWFEDDCKYGSVQFQITGIVLDNTTASTITVRFKEPPKEKYLEWNHHEVTVTLETAQTDYITEAELDTALGGYVYTMPSFVTQPQDAFVLEGDTISLSVSAEEFSGIFPVEIFGHPTTEWSEKPNPSIYKGNTNGYSLSSIKRRSPITVWECDLSFEMDTATRAEMMAWMHYKMHDGAGWFYMYCEFKGQWNTIQCRFVEPPTSSYISFGYWKITGKIETIVRSYTPLADCAIMRAKEGAPPVITTQPQSWTGDPGVEVELSVVVENDETASGPALYQWFYNGTAIPLAKLSTYSFISGEATNGTYHVVVTNYEGYVTSNSVTVLGMYLPSITTQPQDWTGFEGDTVELTIVATQPTE